MNVDAELGDRMFSQSFVLRGRLSIEEWKRFLVEAVTKIGMTPAGEPASWQYPTLEGKGGVGWTVCQPLTESFIVLDSWDDKDGAYLVISSCREFELSKLTSAITAFGLKLADATDRSTLRLA